MAKWTKKEDAWRVPVKSWCENLEESANGQVADLASHPAAFHHVALMPDAHLGFEMPIGGVLALDGAVCPSATGVDIGCGMAFVETNLPFEVVKDMRIRRAFQENLKKRIPVGEGVAHKDEQTWDGFDGLFDSYAGRLELSEWCTAGDVSKLKVMEIDRRNLSTGGSGNHFLELQVNEEDRVCLMIHSGSRNLGKRICDSFEKCARWFCERYHAPLPNGHLAFLPMQTWEGQSYFSFMSGALKYAKESRRRMIEEMKAALDETLCEFAPGTNYLAKATLDVHHNYAAIENHFGTNVVVHRKGATSAKKDEIGIIPGSMGTASYIVRGLGNPESFMSCSHGAGRAMSRTDACNRLTVEECDKAMEGIVCERWGKMRPKGRGRDKLAGLTDLSEAPGAYKDIDAVIAAEADLVEPVMRLRPIAVLKG